MKFDNVSIGIGFTGSFCTYSKIIPVIENLIAKGAKIVPIFSNSAQTINSRFGCADDFAKKITELTGREPVTTIEGAEPLGPSGAMDILMIAPCTGNTVAKLANAITDTPVLMAAKGHLRNGKPLLISLSTNDALGLNMKNIGTLVNSKNIFFVPFGQDDCVKKPNSMLSHLDLIEPSIEAALEGKQLQPMVKSPF